MRKMSVMLSALSKNLQEKTNSELLSQQMRDLICKFISFFLIKNRLLTILQTKPKVQIIYTSCYCLWLLTYNKDVAEAVNKTKLIKELVELMKKPSTHPKILRMVLATLRVYLFHFPWNNSLEPSRIFHQQWTNDWCWNYETNWII